MQPGRDVERSLRAASGGVNSRIKRRFGIGAVAVRGVVAQPGDHDREREPSVSRHRAVEQVVRASTTTSVVGPRPKSISANPTAASAGPGTSVGVAVAATVIVIVTVVAPSVPSKSTRWPSVIDARVELDTLRRTIADGDVDCGDVSLARSRRPGCVSTTWSTGRATSRRIAARPHPGERSATRQAVSMRPSIAIAARSSGR